MKKLAFVLLIVVVGCDDRKVDASKWKDELKTQKFIKVSDGEIASDVQKYATEVIEFLEDTTLPSPDDYILLIEKKYKTTHGVKLCYIEQDNLSSCYSNITVERTVNDTINKVAEIWKAYDAAVNADVTISSSPQFLIDGFYIMYTHPVIESQNLTAMWCMLFERKKIVLNRIE